MNNDVVGRISFSGREIIMPSVDIDISYNIDKLEDENDMLKHFVNFLGKLPHPINAEIEIIDIIHFLNDRIEHNEFVIEMGNLDE